MKLLTNDEINQISGGTQYLAVSTKIEFDGIPAHCVESFFQSNRDNLSSFNVEDLGWNIIRQCPEFDNASHISYSIDIIPISMLLVSYE
jgi:hypothetical protein